MVSLVVSQNAIPQKQHPYNKLFHNLHKFHRGIRSQFATIEIKEFRHSHDRFIIIDDKTVYHFGASLKDLGKKWFAFSKMDIGAIDMLARLDGIKVDGVKQ
jgi:hypothetical protein